MGIRLIQCFKFNEFFKKLIKCSLCHYVALSKHRIYDGKYLRIEILDAKSCEHLYFGYFSELSQLFSFLLILHAYQLFFSTLLAFFPPKVTRNVSDYKLIVCGFGELKKNSFYKVSLFYYPHSNFSYFQH